MPESIPTEPGAKARVTKPPVAVLEAISGGTGLRLQLLQTEDRFAHQIDWVDGELTGALLHSQEGDDGQAWPPSPPLQDYSIEQQESQQGQRDVLLAVGMAGSSHWSISVEPVAEQRSLVFDVACRISGTDLAPRLYSSYEIAGEYSVASTALAGAGSETDSTVVLAPNESEGSVPRGNSGSGNSGPQIRLAPLLGTIHIAGNQRRCLRFEAASPAESGSKKPLSYRWKFSISLHSAD